MHFQLKKRQIRLNPVKKLITISLASSLGGALVGTIWAVYLESYFHNQSYVGFLLAFFTAVSLISYVAFIPMIEKNSKTKLYANCLLIFVVSYFLFGAVKSLIPLIFLGVIISAVTSIRLTTFAIILRDKSKTASVGENVGLVYTFFNLAWLIGPIIAGFVAQKYSFNYVFFLASAFILISLILFKFFKVKDDRVSKKIDGNLFNVLKEFLKDKDRRIIYLITGGVSFWWVLIYIYIPMRIIDSGLSNLILGYFLSLVTVPLVVTEYKFGKLTDKIGFKKMFLISFSILIIASLSCFFIKNIYLVLGILVLASFGAAILEPATEAYFFRLVKKNERDKYYGPYNTTLDVGHGLALVLFAVVLLFLPFEFIFLVTSLFMIYYLFLSKKIKEIYKKPGIQIFYG